MLKKYWLYILVIILLFQVTNPQLAIATAVNLDTTFVVMPYLQLGHRSSAEVDQKLELLWIARSNQDIWDVEVKSSRTSQWSHQKPPQTVNLCGCDPAKLYLFDNELENLVPGEKFQYRLIKNSQDIFHGEGTACKTKNQPYRFALFGDSSGDTSLEERNMAYQAYVRKPDLLVIADDTAYHYGSFGDYLAKFFPIFNSVIASAQVGAPLLQSVPTLPVIGNPDITYSDNKPSINLDNLKGSLSFYEIWSAPLNGPSKSERGSNVPKLIGSKDSIDKYLQAAGARYPMMSNYSFDYGNSHWLILDANP